MNKKMIILSILTFLFSSKLFPLYPICILFVTIIRSVDGNNYTDIKKYIIIDYRTQITTTKKEIDSTNNVNCSSNYNYDSNNAVTNYTDYTDKEEISTLKNMATRL